MWLDKIIYTTDVHGVMYDKIMITRVDRFKLSDWGTLRF